MPRGGVRVTNRRLSRGRRLPDNPRHCPQQGVPVIFSKQSRSGIAWLRGCLALMVCASAVLSHPALAEEPAKVKILVATRNTAGDLQVYYMTKGGMARGMLLPFGSLGNAIAMDARNRDYTKAIGPLDRRATLVDAVRKAFADRSPVFEVVDDAATFSNDDERKALVARAKGQGIRYLLTLEDQFTGISSGTVTAENHDVGVAGVVRFALYDTAKDDRLAKERVAGNSLDRIPLESALTDRAFLEKELPVVHAAIAKSVVGGLVRTDVLHRMAESAGQGDAVPAIGALLKRYEKPVSIVIAPPSGWRTVSIGTKYGMVVEPRDSRRFKTGARADVDILLPELGQGVKTLEEYEQIIFARLSDNGFDASTVKERSDFHKEGYDAFSIVNPATGGGELILFRKLDDTYVAMLTVIATENFEGYLETYKVEYQYALDNTQINTH